MPFVPLPFDKKLPINRTLFFISFFSTHAFAQLVKKTVEYKSGSMQFEGYFVKPQKSKKGKLPGILVTHDWLGLTDKTKAKADAIAQLGYAVFAIDVFGKGTRPSPAEAGNNAAQYYKDRNLFRARMNAGLEALEQQEGVDSKRLAAIGYCFGGSGVMELARSGAPIKAAISFHGKLDSTSLDDGKNIKAKVLALHGADDPYISNEELAAFENEMRTGKVDWQLVKYGNAVHSFTDKSAGNDASKGAAYDAKADRRSWQAMQELLKEIF